MSNLALVYNQKFVNTVTKNFKEFLDTDLYVDLIFVCKNNVKIGAHQIVMSCHSKFFYEMFIENGKTDKEKVIHVYVPDIRARIMKHILEFVYCGKAKVSRTELSEFNEDIKLLGMPLDVFTSSNDTNSAEKNPTVSTNNTVNPSDTTISKPSNIASNPSDTTVLFPEANVETASSSVSTATTSLDLKEISEPTNRMDECSVSSTNASIPVAPDFTVTTVSSDTTTILSRALSSDLPVITSAHSRSCNSTPTSEPSKVDRTDLTYVEDFYDPGFGADETAPAPKRTRRANRVWFKEAEFESAGEAEKTVYRSIWKKSSSKATYDGLRVEYRCSRGTYRVNECPAGLYLLYHASSSNVSVFRTDRDHDNHVVDHLRGLSSEMKAFIKENYDDGIRKPNAILAYIRRKKMTEPSKSKIITYLKTLR